MSHLRNLFHNTPRHEHLPKTSPVAAVAERTAPAAAAAVAGVTTAPVPEFPVEVATLSPENRIVYHDDPRSAAADRFRLLRMRLKPHWAAGKLKKILITGPLAHDGKSTVLLNLATALAERGKRSVLVVDADLHHSSISETLKLRQWSGLGECLADETASPFESVRRIDPLGWYLLPAGEPRRNATELLQTPAFGHIMERLAPSFDWVLIDSPPVIPVTDSISMQQHADATLLVVRAEQTPREALEQTMELLGKKHILGIVLNGMEMRNHLYSQYYDGSVRNNEE